MNVPPESVALIDRRGEVTYGELRHRTDRIRGALQRRGVRAGEAVLVVTANERESVAAYRAVVEHGAIAVLSQVGAGASEVAVACEGTNPVLAIMSSPAVERAGDLPDGLDRVAAEALDDVAELVARQSVPDAARVIVFTSGTTSKPKGVIHSARSLSAAAACMQSMLQLTAADRLFLISPLASITGVLQTFELAPSVGAGVVIEQAFEAESSLDLLVAGGGTVYGGPDVVLDRMLDAARRRGIEVPLRIAALGGSMLRRDLIATAEEDFGIRIVRVYGSSEAPCSTGTRPDEPDDRRLADEGVAGPGVELRLADDGELLVRGRHVCIGYVDSNDEEIASVDGWFRTGDAAEIIGGRLRITGRLKDVVSRNGKKISLAEVDDAFIVASGITASAAFGASDPQTGERVVMAVHLADPADLDMPAVLAAMEAAGLARWKLPEAVVWVRGPLPTTASGKVQRRALTEEAEHLWRASRLEV